MEELKKYNLSPEGLKKIKELCQHSNGFKILATVSEGPGNPEMGEVGYLVEHREIFYVPTEEKVVYNLRISRILKDSTQEELKPNSSEKFHQELNSSEDLYQKGSKKILKPVFSKTFYSKEDLITFIDLLDLASVSSLSHYWVVEAKKIQL